MVRKKREDKAVKIDAEIAKKVEEFISKKDNKIKYSSMKQFIDMAVLDKLEKEEGVRELEKARESNIKLPGLSNKELTWKKEVKVPSGII